MICCLVSNETTNLACFTVNTILSVCLPFIVLCPLFECLMGKESLPAFLSSDDSPLSTRPSCAVFVHINQGAVLLNTMLNTRPKSSLKSALEGDTLKVFMNFRSLAKVKNYAILSHIVFCWIYFMFGYIKWRYSMTKCPQPCTQYKWQQVLVQDINMYKTTSPGRLTVHIGRVGRKSHLRCQVGISFVLYMYIPRNFVTSHLQ